MEAGKELERLARELLMLSGWDVTSGEQLTGYVKADFVAKRREFGRERVVIVECKDRRRPLDQRRVDEVFARYSTVLDEGWADQLLLVTRSGIVAGAAARIEAARKVAHQTLAELERQVMGFDAYLRYLVDRYAFRPDGLPSYYLELSTVEGPPLTQLAEEWLAADSTDPLAVVASYGQGKSAFASRWAAELAQRAAADVTARLPILVEMADVAAEQSVRGLIARALADSVVGYSWPAFDRLNRVGRFVLILDGFDEMRYSLSASSLRHNFDQIQSLIVGDAKVLILGRPTAFVSDEEHLDLLGGDRQIAGHRRGLGQARRFQEASIQLLTPDEIRTLLDGYLMWLGRPEGGGLRLTDEHVRRVRDLILGRLTELASRPVQLKMLVELLPDWQGPLDDLDTGRLYDEFISRVIVRDTTKRAKEEFPVSVRRAFAGDIAWWLWEQGSELRIEPEDIPESIVRRHAEEVGRFDFHAARRELVSGCFLDRRVGGTLVIPHRSFQEFLVAERFLEFLGDERRIPVLDRVIARMSDETAEFAIARITEAQCEALGKRLRGFVGAISNGLGRLWAKYPEVLEREFSVDVLRHPRESVERRVPWWPTLLALMTDSPADRLSALLYQAMQSANLVYEAERKYALNAMLCMFALDVPAYAVSALTVMLSRRYKTSTYPHMLQAGDRIESKVASGAFSSGSVGVARLVEGVPALVQGMRVSETGESLEFGDWWDVLRTSLDSYCFIEGSPVRDACGRLVAVPLNPELEALFAQAQAIPDPPGAAHVPR